MSREPIAVVVATRNRATMLAGCLASLRAALADSDELIVVDSASRDAEPVRSTAAAYDATYVRCDEPGASLARNVGWRAARSDIVAFIDDDTRVFPEWADALASTFTAYRELGFVTGRLDNTNALSERPVAVIDFDHSFAIGPLTVELFGHGANHAMRREALERVGGFDERLGAGGEFRAAEDLDLWDRLLIAGYPGRYVPEMGGWHEQWRRRRNYVGLDWSYGYGGGIRLAKVFRTHRQRAVRSGRLFFGEWGVRLAWRQLGFRQFFLAGLTLIRMCGVVVGIGRGIVIRIDDDGHLARRRRRGGPPPAGPPNGPR